MNQDKSRLDRMLRENKISEADYKVLLHATDKKSFFSKIESSLFINPFQKIAGVKALLLGVLILLLMSFLGVIAKVYFVGVMGVLNAHALVKQAVNISFLLLMYQNLVSWLVLSSIFIIMTKVFQKQKIRIIDFLGTVALARFPLLLLTFLMLCIQLFSPDFFAIDFSQGISMKASIGMSLFGVLALCLFIYQVVVYFYALKVSSGLVGKKLWISFILSFIIAELIAGPLAAIFMN